LRCSPGARGHRWQGARPTRLRRGQRYAQPGALPAAALEELITRVKDLDMDQVRRQLAEAQAAETSAASTAGA